MLAEKTLGAGAGGRSKPASLKFAAARFFVFQVVHAGVLTKRSKYLGAWRVRPGSRFSRFKFRFSLLMGTSACHRTCAPQSFRMHPCDSSVEFTSGFQWPEASEILRHSVPVATKRLGFSNWQRMATVLMLCARGGRC